MSELTQATESADAYVGRRVHHLMWDRRLTQSEFGRRVGIDQSSLAKKLRGTRGWSLDEIRRVAEALETTVGYLFGEGEPSNPGGGGSEPSKAPKRAVTSWLRTNVLPLPVRSAA